MTAPAPSTGPEPEGPSFRDHLRGLRSLVGTPPGFDPTDVPPTPQALFLEWFSAAEHAGVPEPHAMTLSTVGVDGVPDARVLVLKDLTDDGLWCFAGSLRSAKGRQLTASSVAALTFHWRELSRSVRIRGTVSRAAQDVAARDFAARGPDARAIALSGAQSTPLHAADDLAEDVAAARRRLGTRPGTVPAEWAVWRLRPAEVEFWEGSADRLHIRLQYHRDGERWRTRRLRP